MGDVLGAARELERSLAQLLSLLDARGTPGQALGQAARTCADGFEALRASIESGTKEARENLAGVLRTNSIARDLVGRQQAEVQGVLDRIRAARGALGHLSGNAEAGGACDVAG